MRIDRVKLIAEMVRKNLKVLDLAERSGVSRVTISAVRSGKTCSPVTAGKLARGLGVPVQEIIEKEV